MKKSLTLLLAALFFRRIRRGVRAGALRTRADQRRRRGQNRGRLPRHRAPRRPTPAERKSAFPARGNRAGSPERNHPRHRAAAALLAQHARGFRHGLRAGRLKKNTSTFSSGTTTPARRSRFSSPRRPPRTSCAWKAQRNPRGADCRACKKRRLQRAFGRRQSDRPSQRHVWGRRFRRRSHPVPG